jgi:CheY-like chemotaxis protein
VHVLVVAVDCCAADLPDVIVLDVTVTDGSGWDILPLAVARGLSPASVVAISALPPSRSQLARCAPVGFLAKPFPIDALLRAVTDAARKGHRHAWVDHPAI